MLKKYSLAIFCITAFIVTVIAVSKPFSQERAQPPRQAPQTADRQLHNTQMSSSNRPITLLSADELYFEAHMSFPASVLTSPGHYAESITDGDNGALDIAIINQDNTTRYLVQISSLPERQCQPNAARACQQGAATARGNVAEIQFALQGGRLMTGSYAFGGSESTLIKDVMISSRQIYSDPAHGKLGCQAWGRGILNVTKAIYSANARLEYLDIALSRSCDRTASFPPIQPTDNLPQTRTENIERYTYYAAWRCHLKAATAT